MCDDRVMLEKAPNNVWASISMVPSRDQCTGKGYADSTFYPHKVAEYNNCTVPGKHCSNK
jgi:hypothetical protein